MDTEKDMKTEKRNPLSEITHRQVVVGAKQLRKTLSSGKARQVYLAKNADPSITEPLEALCRQNHVDCTWVHSMAELGRACGIEVGAAAAATLQ